MYVCIMCTRLSRQGTRHEITEKVCFYTKSKVLLIAHCIAYSIWKVKKVTCRNDNGTVDSLSAFPATPLQ